MNNFLISRKEKKSQSGQALIALLFFVLIAFVFTTAATTIMIISSQSVTRVELGDNALRLAESAAEDALLKLLRDPTYTGADFVTDDGVAMVVITGDTMTVTATVDDHIRKLVVNFNFINNILSVTSFRQTF